MHVNSIAKSRVGVQQERDQRVGGDVARVIDDVAQSKNAGVGHPEQETGKLRAGQKETAKADVLRHARINRAEAARHDNKVLAGEHRAQFEALATRFIEPFAAHPRLRL